MSQNVPRILFLWPSFNRPNGGTKQAYRMVDILNKNGYNAILVHNTIAYKSNWFFNNTRIAYSLKLYCIFKKHSKFKLSKIVFFLKPKEWTLVQLILLLVKPRVKISDGDILVVPESHIFIMAHFINKYVIYNQGPFLTFSNYKAEFVAKIYANNNLLGIMTNSNYSTDYLNYFTENIKIFQIRHSFNLDELSLEKQKNQICYMSRKSSEDIHQILSLLKLRGMTNNWDFKDINNVNFDAALEIMRESRIFLSSNIAEGFGMPSCEAMSLGCIVIGYTGISGKEYLLSKHSFPIETKDIISFVKTIESVANRIEANDTELMYDMPKESSKFIRDQYSESDEENDIISTWNSIMVDYQLK
jgi:hypothetical protein